MALHQQLDNDQLKKLMHDLEKQKKFEHDLEQRKRYEQFGQAQKLGYGQHVDITTSKKLLQQFEMLQEKLLTEGMNPPTKKEPTLQEIIDQEVKNLKR